MRRHLDEHRARRLTWPSDRRAQLEPLTVTPDKYLTVRYAGASGDFNPIHIDEEFARAVGLPGRILHGLWTMAQVARAQTPRAAGRARSPASASSSAAWACPSTRSRSPARSPRSATGPRWSTRSPSRTARRSSATPKPRSGLRPAGRFLQSRRAHPAPGAHPAQGRRGVHRDRGARRLARAGRRPRRSAPAPRRSATSSRSSRSTGCSPTRTRPRAACRPTRATASTSTACGAPLPARAGAGLELQLVRREVDEAMRTTTETLSQVTNLLAIVSAPPLDTATIRHVEVLLLQPQVLMVVVITSTGGVTKRIFTFADPVDPGLALGGRVPQRAPGRHSAWARACCSRACRPVARRDRAGLPGPARAGVHRAGRDRRGHALRRRRRAAAGRAPRPGPQPDQRADVEVLERRVALLGVLRAALTEHDVLVRIGERERAARAARPRARRRRATGCRRASSAPCR